MFLYNALLLYIASLTCEKIEWKAYKSKHSKVAGITFHNAKISVPADHNNPGTSPKIKIRTRRMCNSDNPLLNIISLTGGPGQTTKIVEKNLFVISHALKSSSYCVYAIDHRGVGGSTKALSNAEAENWLCHLEKLENQTILPLKTLTISNAARDVLKIAELIKKGIPSWDEKKNKFGLIGTSYGSMLAHRAINFNPQMFDMALFDSYAVAERHTIDGDEGLILACDRSPICKKKTGGKAERIRNIISFLNDKNFNKCAAIIHQDLAANKKDQSCHDLMEMFIDPNNSTYGNRLGLALLVHAWTCPDSLTFQKAYNKFKSLKKTSPNLSPESNASEDASSLNKFVHQYLMLSEIEAPYNDSIPSTCQAECPIGMNSRCTFLQMISDNLKRYLYSYNPSERSAALSSSKTKIYVVHGGEDFRTPIRNAIREFNRISSPSKRFIILNNYGHSSAEESPCTNQIYKEIFLDQSQADTDACIQELNLETIEVFDFKKQDFDWVWPLGGDSLKELPASPETKFSFQKNPGIGPDWFDPNKKITSSWFQWNTKTIITSSIILVIVLIGIGLGIWLYIQKRQKRFLEVNSLNKN